MGNTQKTLVHGKYQILPGSNSNDSKLSNEESSLHDPSDQADWFCSLEGFPLSIPQCTSLEDIFILQPSMEASDVGIGESDFSRGTFTVYSPLVQMQDPEYGKGERIMSFPNKLEILRAT